MEHILDHVLYAVRLFASISVVAITAMLMGIAPEQLTRPIFAGSSGIATLLVIGFLLLKFSGGMSGRKD